MKEFILERGYMNINSVASVLAAPITLGDTTKSTLKQGGVHVTVTDVRLNVCFVSAIAEDLRELISVQELQTTN